MALSDAQKDEISLLVKLGKLSNRAIGKKVGCSESAVRVYIKKNGIHRHGDVYKNIKRRYSSIYLIRASGTNMYKIGVANDVGARLKTLQTSHYEKLIIVRTFYNENAYFLEKKLHDKYRKENKHIRGEWFELYKDDIKAIEALCYGY